VHYMEICSAYPSVSDAIETVVFKNSQLSIYLFLLNKKYTKVFSIVLQMTNVTMSLAITPKFTLAFYTER